MKQGKRISLISKKNIRYEGLLYSINEQNATVALQNVRSYGTEGRERELSTPNDPNGTEKFVPPNDAIHPYLLFRGQDIKDLHVHENQSDTNVTVTPTIVATDDSTTATTVADTVAPTGASTTTAKPPSTTPSSTKEATGTAAVTTAISSSAPKHTSTTVAPVAPRNTNNTKPHPSSTSSSSGRGGGRGAGRSTNHNTSDTRARNNNNNNNSRSAPNNQNGYNSAKEGTGARLVSRQGRGMNDVVNDPSSATEIFDFELAATAATNSMVNNNNKEDDGIDPTTETKIAYSKNDFFDSISCDAIDKRSGIDHRLRGHQERKLNTETFGAVALNTRSRGGGRGGRYNSGRSRGGRGGRGYYSNSDDAVEMNANSNNTRGGGRGNGRSSTGGRSNYRGGRNTGPRGSNSGSGRHDHQQPASTTIAANAP